MNQDFRFAINDLIPWNAHLQLKNKETCKQSYIAIGAVVVVVAVVVGLGLEL
jgi:hypothetical protein